MRKNFGKKPWCYPQPVFILAAYDKDGNRIPADESVSAESLRANFTTLGVCDNNDVELDFDNAVVVDLK